MSRSAQQVQLEFARLAGEEAGTLYLEQLLQDGFGAWPGALQRRFPALHLWRGVRHLKQDLKQLTGATSESHVLLASRSAELMKLAAKLAFARCQNVLTTDMSWPNYQRILEREARRHGASVTRLRLRRRIFRERIDHHAVVKSVVDFAVRHRCDGLFLPLVDNLGVRLPVEEIASALRRRANVRFIVVDGAQAINHVPFSLTGNWCDLFLAGCHKWLCAYNPLGLAFFGHPRSADDIQARSLTMLSRHRIDDPLLRFTTQLESGWLTRYGETVSLLPLFTCAAAVHDAMIPSGRVAQCHIERLGNADRLVQLAADSNWLAVQPAPRLRTGVCLLRTRDPRLAQHSPSSLRKLFHHEGLAVTTYHGGLVRLSMPRASWTAVEESHLMAALDICCLAAVDVS